MNNKYIIKNLFLIIVCFVLYFNSIKNDFAWDDQIVLTQNDVTKKGIGNLYEIWTTQSYIQERPTFRPITQTYFAFLWTLFPDNPLVFHLFNLLLYVVLVVSLFNILNSLFKNINETLLFIVAICFVLFPTHTEVVANIKSADELLSAIFILWCLYFANKKGLKEGGLWILFFVLSVLSKVSSITLLPLIFLLSVYRNKEFLLKLLNSNKHLTYPLEILVLISFCFTFTKIGFYQQLFVSFIFIIYLIKTIHSNEKLGIYNCILILVGGFILKIPFELFGIIIFYWISIANLNSKKNTFTIFLFGVLSILYMIGLKVSISSIIINLLFFTTYLLAIKNNKYALKTIKAIITFGIIIFIVKLAVKPFEIKYIAKNLFFLISILAIPVFYYSKDKKQKLYSLVVLFFVVFSFFHMYQYHFFDKTITHEKSVNHDSAAVPINDKVINNQPYNNILVASTSTAQKTATIARIQLLYLQKAIFPVHLVHNYGVWQIEFASWKDWDVYLSILIHLILLYLAYFFFKRKFHITSWGIIWYFCSISIYTNIIRLMPDTLAERFLFLPSIGISVAFVSSIFYFFNLKFKNEKKAVSFTFYILLPLFVYYGYKTIDRNKDWKNNYTLAANTIPYAQNNAAINAQYALELNNLIKYGSITNVDSAQKIILQHYNKAVTLYPNFYGAHFDLATFYILKKDADNALPHLKKCVELYPDEWLNHYFLSSIYADKNKYPEAVAQIEMLEKNETILSSPEKYPEFLESLELKAKCLHHIGKDNEAYITCEKAIQIYNQKSSYILLANLYRITGKRDLAIATFERLLTFNPNDQELINTIQYLKEGKIY